MDLIQLPLIELSAIESKVMLICELCSKYFTPEEFYEHLKEQSKKEVLILKKLSEKSKKMTSEQYRKFLTNLEWESYARSYGI